MAKVMKGQNLLALILIVGMVLVFSGLWEGLPDFASAASVQQQVEVTAVVQEWITFTLSTTSVTLSPDLVDTAGNTNIASSSVIDLYLGTNSDDGWSISVTSTYGALKEPTPYYIYSADCTAATGSDCYGIQATATETGVNIAPRYDYWPPSEQVGWASTTALSFASSTNTFASGTNVIDMKIKASCDSAQPVGTYQDYIYLTAVTSIP